MISLKKIKKQLLEGKQIEEIIKAIDWQEFEKLVSKILEKHEFKCWNNFRFKTERRYEVDIIATKNDLTLLIDCKQWSTGRHKTTALKQSVEIQEERLEEFRKFIKNNPIAKSNFSIKNNQKLIPIIVTWYEENLIKYDETLIIPIWKLNEFLLNMSNYV